MWSMWRIEGSSSLHYGDSEAECVFYRLEAQSVTCTTPLKGNLWNVCPVIIFLFVVMIVTDDCKLCKQKNWFLQWHIENAWCTKQFSSGSRKAAEPEWCFRYGGCNQLICIITFVLTLVERARTMHKKQKNKTNKTFIKWSLVLFCHIQFL